MVKSLQDIGRIAIELHAAQRATKEAKRLYYVRSRRYIHYFIDNGTLDRGDPEFHRVTKIPYEAFRKARAHEYNVKRRLENAIRRRF